MWVDTVSLGKVARSTTRTRYPFRASNIAVGEPAQRAPTTIASNALVIATFLPFLTIRRLKRITRVRDAMREGEAALRGNTPIAPWDSVGDFPQTRAELQWVR